MSTELKSDEVQKDEKEKILNNLAECLLRLERWREAENRATEVLQSSPNNEKALWRRGKARCQLMEVRLKAPHCLRVTLWTILSNIFYGSSLTLPFRSKVVNQILRIWWNSTQKWKIQFKKNCWNLIKVLKIVINPSKMVSKICFKKSYFTSITVYHFNPS